ncbi:transposase [Streptomyces sp. NPDC056224]|uniref:transposase n=1 Tax=Streptomyces sp. NPDC056224 TaxID=3345750 RepID=UPI0035E05A19
MGRLPIGEYAPYPLRLRQQFEGVIWRWSKTGGQWREMPKGFGAWSTSTTASGKWRDAGVFHAFLEVEGLAEAAKWGEVDLYLVSVDSTTARAHHDAAGTHPGEDVVTALEDAAVEAEKASSKKGQPRRMKRAGSGWSGDASGVGTTRQARLAPGHPPPGPSARARADARSADSGIHSWGRARWPPPERWNGLGPSSEPAAPPQGGALPWRSTTAGDSSAHSARAAGGTVFAGELVHVDDLFSAFEGIAGIAPCR